MSHDSLIKTFYLLLSVKSQFDLVHLLMLNIYQVNNPALDGMTVEEEQNYWLQSRHYSGSGPLPSPQGLPVTTEDPVAAPGSTDTGVPTFCCNSPVPNLCPIWRHTVVLRVYLVSLLLKHTQRQVYHVIYLCYTTHMATACNLVLEFLWLSSLTAPSLCFLANCRPALLIITSESQFITCRQAIIVQKIRASSAAI